MKLRDALGRAAERLAPISDTPRLEAELIMAQALGVEREAMLLSGLDAETPDAFEPLLQRREKGEPVAYITGRRAFWTIDLEVGPGVLIPRPDSETLLDAALDHFGEEGPRSILDLGTGPGTLLLAALDQWPEATGLGIDASEAALAFASRNAQRLGLAGRATFQQGNWAEGIGQRFDLLLCNPPYVEEGASLPRDVTEWEPHEALFAGADGLAAYRLLAPALAPLLTENGVACIEIGAGQAEAVSALFTSAGLAVSLRNDLGGRPRCIVVNP